ncbi:MAG: cell division protein FtsQ/DivIB [Dokdonella sp.]
MKGGLLLKLLAWGIALTLIALPVIGVLNGRFASDRWPVKKLQVQAEFNHVSAEQIRTAVSAQLGSGFFALNLDEVRSAVSTLPWVARVDARKRWPDTLELTVYEQLPFARWGDTRLISRSGQLFSVPGTAVLQGLPQMSGPDDRLAEVLAFYKRCQTDFSGTGLLVTAVALSDRGSWMLSLASGAQIAIGHDQVEARIKRFRDVWAQIASSQPAGPAYIDLRYQNGFAVHWAETEPASSAPAPELPPSPPQARATTPTRSSLPAPAPGGHSTTDTNFPFDSSSRLVRAAWSEPLRSSV